MKTTRRAFIKKMNWALAGIIGMLGFADCDKIFSKEEYGTPHADYTVKGKVVNKATGTPIEGIQVGYHNGPSFMYGPPPANWKPKAHVLTNEKGEFKLTDSFDIGQAHPIYVEDIDGEKNGLFKSEFLEVDFKDAVRSGKQKSWYKGEYTVNMNIELTEIEKE